MGCISLYIKNDDKAFYSSMSAEDYIKYCYDNSTDETIDNYSRVSCTYDKSTKLYIVTLSNPTDNYKTEILDKFRGSFEEMTHFLSIKKYETTLVATKYGEYISLKENIELEGNAGTSYSGIKIKAEGEMKPVNLSENEKINAPEDADKYTEVADALVIDKINDMYNDALNTKGGKVKVTYNLSLSAPYNYSTNQEIDIDYKIMKNRCVEFTEKLKIDGTTYNVEYKNGQVKNKSSGQTSDISQETAYMDIFNCLNMCKIKTKDFSTYQFNTDNYTCTLDNEAAEEYISQLIKKSFQNPITINKIEIRQQKIQLFFNEKGELVKAQMSIKAFVNNSFNITEDKTVVYSSTTNEYYPNSNT